MRTAWNVLSFLAVVHLLAIAIFLAWLWRSERLDTSRIEGIRELLAITIPEAEHAVQEASMIEAADRQQQIDDARRDDPPLASRTELDILSRQDRLHQRALRRLEDEQNQRATQLREQFDRLEVERDAFEQRVADWETATAADRERKTDAQFAQMIKLYESLRPALAKDKIVELVRIGKTDQAVTYLDAMNPRFAGKILTEFKTEDENRLATELLERIRMFGAEVEPTEDSSDDDAAGNAT